MKICPLCNSENNDTLAKCSICSSSLATQSSFLRIGTLLDNRYEVTELIGKGGMGSVYKAIDTKLNNTIVAVKEMIVDGISKARLEKAIQSFKKEAALLIELRHPALPRVIDFFPQGEERWFIVMDYIDGNNLEEVLIMKGKIGEEEVTEWLIQICDVLLYLHQNDPPIIFRDLKPSNIMLTKDNKIKLIDFGIAKHIDTDIPTDVTWSYSPGFAPPEQILNNEIGIFTDIYSLGLLLHFLLTGIDPRKETNNKIIEPKNIVDISDELNCAIMKATSIEPENRPKSIEEFMNQIFGCGDDNISIKETITSFFDFSDKVFLFQFVAIIILSLLLIFGGRFKSLFLNDRDGRGVNQVIDVDSKQNTDTQWMKYSSNKISLVFEYPKSWVRQAEVKGKDYVDSYALIEEGNKSLQLKTDFKYKPFIDTKTYVNDNYDDIKLISQENGLAKYETSHKDEFVYRRTLIIVSEDSYIYYLTLEGIINKEKELNEVFDHLIETAAIEKPAVINSEEENLITKPNQSDFNISPNNNIMANLDGEGFFEASSSLKLRISDLLNNSYIISSKNQELDRSVYEYILSVDGLPNIYLSKYDNTFFFEKGVKLYGTKDDIAELFSLVTKQKNQSSYIYKWQNEIVYQTQAFDLNHDNIKDNIKLIYNGNIELIINNSKAIVIEDYWYTPEYYLQEIRFDLINQINPNITNIVVSVSQFTNKIGSSEELFVFYYDGETISKIWDLDKAITPDIYAIMADEVVNISIPRFEYSKNIPIGRYTDISNEFFEEMESQSKLDSKEVFYLGTHMYSEIKDKGENESELVTTRTFGGPASYFEGICRTYYVINELEIEPIRIEIELLGESQR